MKFIFFFVIKYLTFCTLSINNATAQITKKADAIIVEVFRKTKDKTPQGFTVLWNLYYVIIENKVYSGDDFKNNHIFLCRSLDGYLDTIPNNTFLRRELRFLKDEKIDGIPLKKFTTKLRVIDDKFYWHSIIVPIEYIDLPWRVEGDDFLKFLYMDEYNALYIKKIDLKNIKEGHFPKFILDKMIENRKCLSIDSYYGFEDCLKKP